MKLKKILSLLLAVTCVAVALPSCGKTEKFKLTNVFKETRLKLPDEYTNNDNFYMNQLFTSGGRVIAQCNEYNSETGGSREYLLEIHEDGSVGMDIDLGLENTDNSWMNLNGISFDENGGATALINKYQYDENGSNQTYFLRQYDLSTGKYTDTSLDFPQDDENGDRFYPNYFVSAADGTVLIGSWNGVKLLRDGKFVDLDIGGDSSTGSTEVNGFMPCGGKIYVSIASYSETGSDTTCYEVDTVNAKLGEEIDIGNTSFYFDSWSTKFGPGYDFYNSDANGVYGCTLKDSSKVEVINFINSDIDSNLFNNYAVISQDKFMATGYDSDLGTNTLSLYTRVPDDQIAEKTIITLATNNLYYSMRKKILNFNKSSDTYRITVTDYSQYNTNDDYTLGTTRFNTDLIAGKIPDIILVNGDMNYSSYVSKGLFTDLYQLMEADESFHKEDYLENVFKAYEVNGKLYSLVPSVQLQTFAAKTSLLDGITHWNASEFMQYVKNHPEIQPFDYDTNRDMFINYMLRWSRDSFIDADTGECHFDSDEFKALLEFAKSLSTDDFWSSVNNEQRGDDFWQEYRNRYADNRVLLTQVNFYDLVDAYKNLMYYTLKEDATFVGFPSDNGNGASFYSDFEYCISSRSKNKEGAWEFLKTLISEDAQMPVKSKWGYWSTPVDGIPILKKAVDLILENGMTPPENDDSRITIGKYDLLASSVVSTSSETASAETETTDEKKVATSNDTASAETETAETTEAVDDGEAVDVNGDGIIDENDVAEDTASSDGDIVIDDPIIDYEDPYNTPLTQAQVDQIRALLEGTTQIARADEKLNNIVTEEASAYFEGQKSLDDTVRIIQNRASTYISESR